ncbi:MAG: hypothetical protein M1823_002752 [Watsoniomyces obsoletus]|nr:MAG: hypothetical protein M1823_002752 [Watsoniomyces obsoletus]
MGWFWGTSTTTSSTTNAPKESPNNPVGQLDPSLREYVQDESPGAYIPIASSQTKEAPSYRDQLPRVEPAQWSESGVPPQALYQDGRYAKIWETYKPLEEIEAANKTDQEKLLDIVEGWKERKAQISRAALENCSLEQIAVSDCFRFGGWGSRMTMCRAENKTFERCYVTQAKFLKALGYLSTIDRPPQIDEQIQMHADKLYHRMLAQEALIEKAQEEGKPLPITDPLFTTPARPAISPQSSNNQTPPQGSSPSPGRYEPPTDIETILAKLPPASRKRLEEQLKGISSPVEREIEAKAFMAEIQATNQTLKNLEMHRRELDEGIKRRAEKGQGTFGDWVTKTFRY